jgi:hypothetical protein
VVEDRPDLVVQLFPKEEYHVDPELYVDPVRFSIRVVVGVETIVWAFVKRDEYDGSL